MLRSSCCDSNHEGKIYLGKIYLMSGMFGESVRLSLQAHLEFLLLKVPCMIRPVLRTSHTIVSPGGHSVRGELFDCCLPGFCAHAATARTSSVLAISNGLIEEIRLLSLVNDFAVDNRDDNSPTQDITGTLICKYEWIHIHDC